MGAQLSKGGVAVRGKAAAELAASKANGQENGHVKNNGDLASKPGGEVDAADGNGTAEPAKEGAADIIEPAPEAEGEDIKVEGEIAKNGKKKKNFLLKNSFQFKGILLKKGTRGSEEGKKEAITEDKPEENGHTAKETKEQTKARKVKEGEIAAPADAAPKSETKTEKAPPKEAAPTEGAADSSAVDTTPATSEGEVKAE